MLGAWGMSASGRTLTHGQIGRGDAIDVLMQLTQPAKRGIVVAPSLNMNIHLPNQFTLRDRIIELLSDDEYSELNSSDIGKLLVTGEEYVDFSQLNKGVLTASLATVAPLEGVLPRRAVPEATWSSIVQMLPTSTKDKNTSSRITNGEPTKRSSL